jgi:hypothetical protein
MEITIDSQLTVSMLLSGAKKCEEISREQPLSRNA